MMFFPLCFLVNMRVIFLVNITSNRGFLFFLLGNTDCRCDTKARLSKKETLTQELKRLLFSQSKYDGGRSWLQRFL